jgi:hypothetical protein
MKPEYKVSSFIPTIMGCGAQDNGWDRERCEQFQTFLNNECSDGWKLHSCEYRQVTVKSGCGANNGAWLVCIFEKI